MILSFAWTTPAVVLGEKSETRRDWTPRTIQQARKQMVEGKLLDAWSKSPHREGKPFGKIQILRITESEPSWKIPHDAWEREGFHILQAIQEPFQKGYFALDVWNYWMSQHDQEDNCQTVIEFCVAELNDYGRLLAESAENRLLAAGGPVRLCPGTQELCERSCRLSCRYQTPSIDDMCRDYGVPGYEL